MSRHGSAEDRGSADAYYRRPYRPHYFVGGSFTSEEITTLSDEDLALYRKGYDEQMKSGDHKDWGIDDE